MNERLPRDLDVRRRLCGLRLAPDPVPKVGLTLLGSGGNLLVVRRVGLVLGAALVVLGVFGVGYESGNGVNALYEHWWCLTPFVVIVLGLASVITA